MPHKLLFLDFETYYDAEYSLKKLIPPEYILDPRYETIMCAVKEPGQRPTVIDGPDMPKFLAGCDPANTTTVTFNALFDNCILAWKYGFVPSRMYCSMRMAAALRGHLLPSVSLAAVCKLLGLPPKGTFIENMKGKHRADLRANINDWNSACTYAMDDVMRCEDIFNILAPEFPSSERRVMDMVLRCAMEPRFSIDTPMLEAHLKELAADKVEMLRLALGQPTDDGNMAMDPEEYGAQDMEAFAKELRSNPKFEALLQSRGVDIEYKQSITDPERQIPAFAKTDEFMEGLMEHEDPVVQALATARLGLRSTIEESRGKRIMSVASLPWPVTVHGNMPIPLRYSGAHTHRLSGDWKINMQNLPAGRGKNKSKLRKSLIAPPGHKAVVADLAQIECRITAWLCGQKDLLDEFARGGDPYSTLGGKIFGFKVIKEIHKLERFIGKTGVLGLGFGCGAPKFYNMVVRSARVLGMDVKKLLEVWTQALAQKSVDIYRNSNWNITGSWRKLDDILATAWVGKTPPVRWGPVIIGQGYVELPNHMKMHYKVQGTDPTSEDGLTYVYGRRLHKLYGAKFLENIVQALARIVIMNAALRLRDRGYRFALQAHDELVFIVPDDDVENCKRVVMEEMTRRPSWALTIPLNAEVGSGQSYGEAK